MKKRDEFGRFISADHPIRNEDGYRLIYMPEHPRAKTNGYVMEHVLIMEKILGRPLTDQEVVHHIDGDKTNNSPDNLMVFANSGEHTKYHWQHGRAQKYKLKNGEELTIKEIAERANANHSTIYQRIKKQHWTPDEAIQGHKDGCYRNGKRIEK